MTENEARELLGSLGRPYLFKKCSRQQKKEIFEEWCKALLPYRRDEWDISYIPYYNYNPSMLKSFVSEMESNRHTDESERQKALKRWQVSLQNLNPMSTRK